MMGVVRHPTSPTNQPAHPSSPALPTLRSRKRMRVGSVAIPKRCRSCGLLCASTIVRNSCSCSSSLPSSSQAGASSLQVLALAEQKLTNLRGQIGRMDVGMGKPWEGTDDATGSLKLLGSSSKRAGQCWVQGQQQGSPDAGCLPRGGLGEVFKVPVVQLPPPLRQRCWSQQQQAGRQQGCGGRPHPPHPACSRQAYAVVVSGRPLAARRQRRRRHSKQQQF